MKYYKYIPLIILLNNFHISFAQVTANFSESSTYVYCPPMVTNFTDLSTGNPNYWHWEFGDGQTSLLQNPTHFYIQSGTYTVTLIVSDGANLDSLVKTNLISIGGVANIGFSYSVDSANLSTVTFTNTIPFASDYNNSWSFGDGQGDTTMNPIHTFISSNTYNVCLSMTDINACSILYCDSVHISTSLGLKNIALNDESTFVYPNPVSNQLTINNNGFIINEINIIDHTGNYLKTITSGLNIVNVSNLPSGIYFIELVGEKKSITQKFIKR